MTESIDELALTIATAVRAAVAPSLGDPGARERVGVAPGGDTTMAIDEIAELVVERCCAGNGQHRVSLGRPRLRDVRPPAWILVVDPIDGTRPAAAGLESCCVSVAVVPPREDATLGDVTFGVVHEIKSGDRFSANAAAGRAVSEPTEPRSRCGCRATSIRPRCSGPPAYAAAQSCRCRLCSRS